MFPSHNPFVFVLHFIVVLVAILGTLVLGIHLNQPLAALSLLALQYLPQVPITPSPEMIYANNGGDDGEDQDIGYHNTAAGFGDGKS